MKIIGCGGYLPKRILSNFDLEKVLNTSDEWIKSRTGISQRHIASDFENTSDMALKAAESALTNAGISASSVDLIIVCTTTPDNVFPSTASKLQSYLSIKNVPAFDLQAVCSGFIYGLQIADSLIKTNKYETILLVGAEKMSSLLDWNDRNTCILFGDGAGAIIVKKDEGISGLIDSRLYSDGNFYHLLYTSNINNKNVIKMEGQTLFKHAVEKMSESILELTSFNNIEIDDITYFIPHQANIRIIDSIANRLKLNPSKIVKTIAEHANCSAASIPLALNSISALLVKGDVVLFSAVGAGLTWGTALIRW